MKTICLLLFFGFAAHALALMGEVTEPGLALPADFSAAARTSITAALRRPDCRFLGGTFFNSDTHLKYEGDTLALNLFLEGLTKCPGFTLSIRFYRYSNEDECDWVVDHYGIMPGTVCVRVNLNSTRIKLDDLVVPEVKRPSLPETKPSGATQLHKREINLKNPEGKDLVMAFEELRRDEKTSTATVKRVSGASVPSAMFVLRGGAAYFVNLKEWDAEDGPRMYLIGFAPDKNVDQAYFGLKEPLPADGRLQFLPVKDYERIFKDQP